MQCSQDLRRRPDARSRLAITPHATPFPRRLFPQASFNEPTVHCKTRSRNYSGARNRPAADISARPPPSSAAIALPPRCMSSREATGVDGCVQPAERCGHRRPAERESVRITDGDDGVSHRRVPNCRRSQGSFLPLRRSQKTELACRNHEGAKASSVRLSM